MNDYRKIWKISLIACIFLYNTVKKNLEWATGHYLEGIKQSYSCVFRSD